MYIYEFLMVDQSVGVEFYIRSSGGPRWRLGRQTPLCVEAR